MLRMIVRSDRIVNELGDLPHPRTRHFHSGGDPETVFLLVLLGDLHQAVDEWLDEEIIGFEPGEAEANLSLG